MRHQANTRELQEVTSRARHWAVDIESWVVRALPSDHFGLWGRERQHYLVFYGKRKKKLWVEIGNEMNGQNAELPKCGQNLQISKIPDFI